jgi:hypothetical protein
MPTMEGCWRVLECSETIERFRAEGKKPTATRLAQATKMSREQLARKYRHLFERGKCALSCQTHLLRNHSFQARSLCVRASQYIAPERRKNERSDLP